MLYFNFAAVLVGPLRIPTDPISPLQEGLQDELSSYADDVFETASEAALKQVDESKLTGSALDKSALERSHLMLCVYHLFDFCVTHIV